MKIGIITVSDKGSRGERVDESGALIKKIVTEKGWEVTKYTIIPDEKIIIENELREMCDNLKVNIILTTGGTGFSKRDVTPEATLNVIERETSGIAEAMRYESLKITKRAMLSRAVSGIRRNTLIVNLPGSPKAVSEMLNYIIDPIEHGVKILNGEEGECAR